MTSSSFAYALRALAEGTSSGGGGFVAAAGFFAGRRAAVMVRRRVARQSAHCEGGDGLGASEKGPTTTAAEVVSLALNG